jgi:peptidoglycan/xylan/chitin deacetylase (PgdA/CDA1 family)
MMSKQTLQRAVARMAPETSGAGVRVLLYHAVDDPIQEDALSLRVSRPRFLEQMTLLRDDGYEVVPLEAVLDPRKDSDRARVAVTFDDGYISQAWAADVLRELGFPATFFLAPRFLDGVRSPAKYWEGWGHLGWDAAAALIEDGFEIGAHSTTHPDLRTCVGAQLEQEVLGAKQILEARLPAEITTFSYPHGRYDDSVKNAVQHAGYRLACTSRYGLNRASGQPYLVRRTEVCGTDTLQDFRWKLRGKHDWRGYWQELKRIR